MARVFIEIMLDEDNDIMKIIGASEPAIGSSEPAVGSSEPAVGSSKPAIGSSEPAVGSSEPAVGSSEPAVGGEYPAEKPGVVSKLIPAEINECALYLGKAPNEPCMSKETIGAVGAALNLRGDSKRIVDGAKETLNCDTERCVLSKLTTKLGENRVRKEINLYLKINGPTSSQLLSNIHIDSTLKQWGAAFSDFFPYNFNMRNYASYAYENGYIVHHPDTLATILFSDLYSGEFDGKKYRCCGCVINTDTYQGPGKHWMALFADARAEDRWTVEFFNSSGNSPSPEWVNWMEKTKIAMERLTAGKKIPVEIIKVTSIRHQRSKSECGLYSLFYIWSRLQHVPPEFFMKVPIPDSLMFEFRQHLFEDPARKPLKKFDWNEYKKTTDIKWEAQ